jgi:hypothetical protein
MPRSTQIIRSEQTGAIKLSPAPILPPMSFDVSNQTGADIRVVIDGKRIRLEPATS